MAKRKAAARRRPTSSPRRAAGTRKRAASRKAAGRKRVARKRTAKARPAARKRVAKRTPARASARKGSAKTIKAGARKAAASKRTARKATKPTAKPPVKLVAKPAKPVATKVAPPPNRAAKAAATAARLGKKKHALGLDRERRVVHDDDVVSAMPPSSLNLDRTASSARTGRQELKERYDKHTETSPAMTGGDVDADWESAYSVGDEAPGGDNPTPDQNVVDDIGLAVGNEYRDNEELEGADKIEERDKHRWEYDPASSEDFKDR